MSSIPFQRTVTCVQSPLRNSSNFVSDSVLMRSNEKYPVNKSNNVSISAIQNTSQVNKSMSYSYDASIRLQTTQSNLFDVSRLETTPG